MKLGEFGIVRVPDELQRPFGQFVRTVEKRRPNFMNYEDFVVDVYREIVGFDDQLILRIIKGHGGIVGRRLDVLIYVLITHRRKPVTFKVNNPS